MNRKIIAALLGASLLAGGGAYAAQQSQTTQPAPRGPMMHADANNDGIITRAEVLADVDARFAKDDSNKDGQVSAEERRAARPDRGPGKRGQRLDATNRGAPALERFDADKDGKLSDAERAAARAALGAERGTDKGDRAARRAKMLAQFDTDKDGKLSDIERAAAREARKGTGGRHQGRGNPGHLEARIDANGDKLISRDESRTAALAMFDRADADKDGRIDASEREAVRAKMKAMRGQHRGRQGQRGDTPPPPPAPAVAPAPSSGN